MNKNYFFILLILILTNCSAPGSALLGPVFTGATTKSVAHASLSFGTNQIISKLHEASEKSKKSVKKLVKKIDNIEFDLHRKTFFHSDK